MTTFDPEAGVLRLSHAALSVLATLAADPTAPTLTDHATAPPLAELRRARIVGPAGIHPDVRPLAAVVGAPRARFDLAVAERGTAWRAPGWVDHHLVVLAIPMDDGEDAFDLVADAPASAADLLGELVGLSTGLPDPRTAPPAWEHREGARASSVHIDELHALLSGEGARLADGLSDADGRSGLQRAIADVRVRWRVALRDPHDGWVEVLDAGDSGLWRVSGPDEAGSVRLDPASPVQVRARVTALIETALEA